MVPYRGENTDEDGNDGDWGEYKKLVLSQIRELCQDNQSISKDIATFRSEIVEKISAVKEDIARLNVKAGLWGALAGAVFAGTSILLQMMSSK